MRLLEHDDRTGQFRLDRHTPLRDMMQQQEGFLLQALYGRSGCTCSIAALGAAGITLSLVLEACCYSLFVVERTMVALGHATYYV